MLFRNLGMLVGAAFVFAACTPPARTLVTVAEPGQLAAETKTEVKSDRKATEPKNVILTREDITDRAYKAIADIKVVVRRLFLPDPDPTQAEADLMLKTTAAALGADAVVLVRYGSSGITLTTWGTLESQGRAVYFTE
jgi:hypothetical protein